MRVVKNILGVFFCFAAFVYAIMAIAEKQAFWLIGVGVALVLAVLLLRKTKKDKAKAAAKYAAKHKPLTREDFKPVQGIYAHTAGLPIAPGIICSLILTENGLDISSSGANFKISIDKITSISTKTDTEIKTNKQYVSSAGGALAGAMLFGVPGAIIGGRAKEKETKTTTYKNYMVVTYKKDDTVAYLIFALTGTPMQAMPFIKNFNLLTLGRQKETIEL
jgi:uncharacterized membrane protein YfcA